MINCLALKNNGIVRPGQSLDETVEDPGSRCSKEMSNADIEKVLAEIRERVRAQIRRQNPVVEPTVQPQVANNAALDSLAANLSVIQRSWNKLPPLTSYRKGRVAKFELWLKRVLKRATHWFTWEQVNFNSATANTVQSSLMVLAEHDQALFELRQQLERVSLAVAELKRKFQGLPQNGDFRAIGEEAAIGEGRHAAEARAGEHQQPIDAEIANLFSRIEKLRALKAEQDQSL